MKKNFGRNWLALFVILFLSCCVPRKFNNHLESRDHNAEYFRNFDYSAVQLNLKNMSLDERPVLVFSDFNRNTLGGVSTILKQLDEFAQVHKIKIVWVESSQFESRPVSIFGLSVPKVTVGNLKDLIMKTNPQAVHIVTEGPLGIVASQALTELAIPFSTAYHTNMSGVGKSLRIPFVFTKSFVRAFHSRSSSVMSPSGKMTDDLLKMGIPAEDIKYWTHGVDLKKFKPKNKSEWSLANQKLYAELKIQAVGRPLVGFVGRLSPERNIPEMISMPGNYLKVYVGSGPQEAELKELVQSNLDFQKKNVFLGAAQGEDLVEKYNMFDALMFDATSDSFGLVHLESAACGTPVAGISGTVSDFILTEDMGVTRPLLQDAVAEALKLDRLEVRRAVEIYDVNIPLALWFYYLVPLKKSEN